MQRTNDRVGKKQISFLLGLIFLVALAGCGGAPAAGGEPGNVLIQVEAASLEEGATRDEEDCGLVRINGNDWSASQQSWVEEGSQVSIEAQAEDGWDFDGWYENGEKVSSSAEFQFLADTAKDFDALFSENPSGDITEDVGGTGPYTVNIIIHNKTAYDIMAEIDLQDFSSSVLGSNATLTLLNALPGGMLEIFYRVGSVWDLWTQLEIYGNMTVTLSGE